MAGAPVTAGRGWEQCSLRPSGPSLGSGLLWCCWGAGPHILIPWVPSMSGSLRRGTGQTWGPRGREGRSWTLGASAISSPWVLHCWKGGFCGWGAQIREGLATAIVPPEFSSSNILRAAWMPQPCPQRHTAPDSLLQEGLQTGHLGLRLYQAWREGRPLAVWRRMSREGALSRVLC